MRDEKKKLLIISAGIIGIVILITAILLIYNAIFGSKTSYKDIENKVLVAAKKYYNDNKNLLPQNETEQVSTTDEALTNAGYLKEMSKLTKKMKDVSCRADVMVSYANANYRYTVLLDCGDKYSSKTLSSYILKNEPKVYTGDGLYELNGEFVYRGEKPNNYVKFSNKMWRIVKITDNEVVLILDQKLERYVWDNRYNIDRKNSDGINDYRVSRMKDKLLNIYNGETLVSKDYKGLLAVHNLYIGKRSESDAINDGSSEKSTVYENQYIGLLPLYDYLNASIDSNCHSSLTNSCTNYNYLSYYDYNWWLLTADISNTYKVYKVSTGGGVDSLRASSYGYIRPVIHLAKDALYVSGDGTSTNPYMVK